MKEPDHIFPSDTVIPPITPKVKPKDTTPSTYPAMAWRDVGDDGKKIPHTMDARVWASEFIAAVEKNPGIPVDQGTMIGWFANAIMAGYDEANRRAKASAPL